MSKKNHRISPFIAPRIYNLFPRLLGKISHWQEHLKRIRNMDFNWVYINPINYPGFSGSLYSIKEYFYLNPMFAENEDDAKTWGSFKTFVTVAHALGIKVMLDLVINHTAIDCPLIEEHPSWFKKKWALIEKASGQVIKFFEDNQDPEIDEYPPSEYYLERRIANPYAVDPNDSRKITIWGDLAEIDYHSPQKDEILSYWKKLIDFYLRLGVDGFRCDAAYKIPTEVWEELISYTKAKEKHFIFLAETLGCTPQETEAIVKAGFDYIYNSSKYWDFTAPWCLEQYNLFRSYAPSISFPESHDTVRLAKETGGRIDIQKFRYLFSCFFSTGVLMPFGYEFGFKRKLDVVEMTPKDIEPHHFDISDAITNYNRFSSLYRTLHQEGPLIACEYNDLTILVLKKRSLDEKQQILLVYNKDWHNPHDVFLADIHFFLDMEDAPIFIIDPDKPFASPQPYSEKSFKKTLPPNGYYFFLQEYEE